MPNFKIVKSSNIHTIGTMKYMYQPLERYNTIVVTVPHKMKSYLVT